MMFSRKLIEAKILNYAWGFIVKRCRLTMLKQQIFVRALVPLQPPSRRKVSAWRSSSQSLLLKLVGHKQTIRLSRMRGVWNQFFLFWSIEDWVLLCYWRSRVRNACWNWRNSRLKDKHSGIGCNLGDSGIFHFSMLLLIVMITSRQLCHLLVSCNRILEIFVSIWTCKAGFQMKSPGLGSFLTNPKSMELRTKKKKNQKLMTPTWREIHC